MRSPIVAMLWENWQLTRVEAGQRLGLGLVLGGGALTFFDNGASVAFWVNAFLHAMIWFSIAKLNGGKFADGYKPGFPLYLQYTRPVPTVVFVGVAMLYDALSCVALYLVSAALLGLAFGQPLPMFSMVLWLVVSHFAYACIQWSTPSRVVQWLGSVAFSLPMFLLLKARVTPALQIEFSLLDNALIALLGIVSVVLTVVGVARQRRGDSVATPSQRKEQLDGFPDWFVTLFRFPCPTSSATRAQIWFELRSSGLPVLVIGLILAIAIFLASAISTNFGNARYFVLPIAIFALPIALFGLGGNAFGMRRKQGRAYASAFELTQPYGTAQLASLKVLVRAACVLVALMAIGASLWASSSLVGAWGEWALNNNKDAIPLVTKVRQKFAGDFGGLAAYAYAAFAIAACITVVSVIAWQAAREALRTRYPRLLFVVQWLPIPWGLASMALSLAHAADVVSISAVRAFFTASFWISGAAFGITAIYLLWHGLTQRALTARYACGALLVALAFGAAWLAGMPSTSLVALLWPVCLILMLGVLAPWSLNRVRHV